METRLDVLLCSQCGEQPAAMVKVDTDDGWCATCLDEAAEPPAEAAVRREVAEEIAAAIETLRQKWDPQYDAPLIDDAARIAREVGNRP